MVYRWLAASIAGVIALSVCAQASSGVANCHVDVLIDHLNYARIGAETLEAVTTDMADILAHAMGIDAEDVFTRAKVKHKVELMSGTTVFKWLPQTWPSRTAPNAETTLVDCVVRVQRSTLFIAQAAVRSDAFKQEVTSRLQSSLGSSGATTGGLVVLDSYIHPVEEGDGSEPESAGRQPWAISGPNLGGGGSLAWGWWLVIFLLLILVVVVFILGFLSQKQKQTQRQGGLMSVLGREPPKETWRDKFNNLLGPVWRKPPGGYGYTGH